MTPTPGTKFEAFDATRDFSTKDFRALCYAPYVQLSFTPDGGASACCHSRTEPLGNLREHRLLDAWNGERIQQFRDKLRRYEVPAGCASCERMLDAKDSLDHPIRDFDVFPVGDRTLWPARLEFALSNVCNLACVMCTGDLSSAIRAREGLPPLPRAYDDQFFEDLRQFLPHARTLSFLGGEPFLQKECHRIWDMLIEDDLAPNCAITTNGTVFDARVERVLHNLPVDLNISIDGVSKETLEGIRLNVKHEVLWENIRRFQDYVNGSDDRYHERRKRYLTLNFCLTRTNWREAPDFFLMAEDMGCALWTALISPPYDHGLLDLPAEELIEVHRYLETRTEEVAPRLQLHNNQAVWTELVQQAQYVHSEHYFRKADQAAEDGDHSAAEAAMQTGLELAPERANEVRPRQLLLRFRRDASAADAVKRELREFVESDACVDEGVVEKSVTALAAIWEAGRELEEARDVLGTWSVSDHPHLSGSPSVWTHLAIAHRLAGEEDSSDEALASARRIDPNHPYATRLAGQWHEQPPVA